MRNLPLARLLTLNGFTLVMFFFPVFTFVFIYWRQEHTFADYSYGELQVISNSYLLLANPAL